MKKIRKEIMPGVFLTHIGVKKFKTSCLSVSMLTQLNRENAFKNALIPFVLRRGTTHYGNMEAISNRLDDLYGASIEPVIRRVGEIQCIGLYSSFAEGAYLPEGENIIDRIIDFVSEMLIHPSTRGGLLIPDYVESEKQKLVDLIDGRINEKRSYSIGRCAQEMCLYEDYCAGKYGLSEDASSVNYKSFTKHYHRVLSSSPVEIIYCGRESYDTISSFISNSFATLPRSEIDYDIGTDIRMNALEDAPRYYEENLDVTQGKLVLGYRLGECMENPDVAALNVFNTVFGSGITSKLFMNVREKLSLCYYASSIIDRYKGIMLVASGIDFQNYDAAKNEIIKQLNEVKNGNITDDELAFAKKGLISDLSAIYDSPQDIESFYFGCLIEGAEYSPNELSYLISEVTKQQVMDIASSVVLDLVYFLRDCHD